MRQAGTYNHVDTQIVRHTAAVACHTLPPPFALTKLPYLLLLLLLEILQTS